jgi:hypothetical protein
MNAMDHAAAHERIEDLILEPARMRALAASRDPEDVALREHVDGCRACRDDLEAWDRLQRRVAAALPSSTDEARSAVEPIEAPPSLRAAVLVAARAAGDPERAVPAPAPIEVARRRRPVGAWLALAASIVVLVGATVITVDQVNRRAAAEADAQELAAAIAVVDRMLATDHRVVDLRTPEGAVAGTISWSRHDWVVLTNALPEPPSGQEYLCWLETDGRNVPVGHMEVVGGSAYWVASLDEWQTWEIGPTTRFVVTLEATGAEQRTGTAILEARLRS